MTGIDIRAVNTEDLKVLWEKAGDGKRPAKEFVDNLDPEGKHTIRPIVAFMGPQSDEHRCSGLAKMRGKEAPTPFEIDMLVDDFERLIKIADLLEMIRPPKEDS